MTNIQKKHSWQSYVQNELAVLVKILDTAGYTLNDHQPHTLGERFLMQNITTASGQKIILLGQNGSQQKVVIKATRDKTGRDELTHERACRELLQTINFAYDTFHTPVEQAFWSEEGFTISIQTYIDQLSTFIARPLEEQFSYALAAFKNQESARATTSSHYQTIAKTFGIRTSEDYLRLADSFKQTLIATDSDESVLSTIATALDRLHENGERIEQYCGFLTHTDFVPHNFRIQNNVMYLLDCSSLEFGNKHESWARFLNFMTLYNPELENLLITYVEQNRATEERESLQLMRLYRLVEIITYYTKTLTNSEDDLLTLNKARIKFWHEVLKAELKNKRIARDLVTKYKELRDQLRSESENKRQLNLH